MRIAALKDSVSHERGIVMKCRMRPNFSGLLLLGTLVLLLGWAMLNPPSAAAAIRQLEEAPGQIVYQSRQTLKDQHGNSWQAIAFKRIRPDEQTSFELRLVGFPGVVEIDRSQPLTLITSLGKILTAADVSSHIFTETTKPEPNVGQYDLQPLLPQLQMGIPLKLTLPTINGEAVSLSISPLLIEEWQTVARRE
ncbi:DUF3122 domain-containing protein [Nodularia sp. UHCC 0506]|uniref:DUF3122 domain-containing protein n=1 Tax=Nodularia sp. UHCC 0506 TaxID=3110243 RepID=UPI002B1FD576|nr:DUF3122 domain-containing protein [Nodularia sp. UHCC 0506]MEA5513381.1 DUF3122 domain-containing protein [Nodularia sp. UHCC 0506]